MMQLQDKKQKKWFPKKGVRHKKTWVRYMTFQCKKNKLFTLSLTISMNFFCWNSVVLLDVYILSFLWFTSKLFLLAKLRVNMINYQNNYYVWLSLHKACPKLLEETLSCIIKTLPHYNKFKRSSLYASYLSIQKKIHISIMG